MKKKFFFVLLLILSFPFLCSNPYNDAAKFYPPDCIKQSESANNENKILLKFSSIDIEKEITVKIEKFAGEKHFILKNFENSNKILELKSKNYKIIEKIQGDIFLVKSNFEGVETLKKLFPESLLIEYKPLYKIDPSLLYSNWKEAVVVEALLHKGEKPESLSREIKKHFFITALGDEKNGFRLRWLVEKSQISIFARELSNYDEVCLIYPWFLPSPLNDDSIWVIQSYDTANKRNYSLSAVMFNHSILGQNEIATICDTGLDNDMCYFSYDTLGYATAQYPALPQTGQIDLTKKVIAYSVLPGATAYDNDSNCGAFNQYHGTHTSGTLVGDNFANLSSESNIGHDTADGMAPMAKLYFQDAGDDISGCLSGLASDYRLIFKQSYDAGARVHSNSWGAEANGEYTTDSFSVDDFCYNNDDFVICFAAGNSGYLSQTINTPATAKNCITVGSLTNGSIGSNKVSDFSSKGPTKDGRIKPELCAPGENILSASGTSSSEDRNCSFKAMSGTSMATPTLAGGAVLLRNYFTQGFYPSGEKNPSDSFNPTSALIKSALVAGAMDVGEKDFPNFAEGFGRINLDRFCYFKTNEKDNLRAIAYDVRNYAGIKEGEEMVFKIPAKGYLKAVLSWIDPPASLLSSKTLVNNLDLKVISPSGQVYYGNNFQNGNSVSGGSADSTNNTEMFFLENCEEGIWKIAIAGSDIKGTLDYPYSDRQGFALAIVKEYGDSPQNAPQITALSDSGSEGVRIEWNLTEGADSYSIYRIDENGDNINKQTFIGQTSENFFYDTKVQGGYSYSYFVRALKNGFEGESSQRESIIYSGNCSLLPSFSGVKEWQNDYSTDSCDIILSWDNAVSKCPLGNEMSYNIYRESFPNFSPSQGNRIAKGVIGLSYEDAQVPANSTFYYIVRSEDSTTMNSGPANGGNEDRNLKWINATPFGNDEEIGNLSDDGGDTFALLAMEEPFIISTLTNHTPNGRYCYSLSKNGEPYPNSVCASLYSPKIKVASSDSEFSYYTKYNLEYGWDGVAVEISEDGGENFVPSIPNENYPSSFFLTGDPPINSCHFPSTQGCFSGPQLNDSLTEWQKFSHNLGSYKGKEIIVRWRFSSDPASQYDGFFLDDITFKNVYIKRQCASKTPTIIFDKSQYNCEDTAEITAKYYDKKGAKTLSALVYSDSEEIPENILLYENPLNSGIFSSQVLLTSETVNGDGKIGVKDKDKITATISSDSQSFSAESSIDCLPPQLTLLAIAFSNGLEAEISFETSEMTTAVLRYGETEETPNSIVDESLSLSHRIKISSLSPCTQYYYSISLKDYANNSYQSDIKTFKTKMCYPAPIIQSIKILKDPFRLQIAGANFQEDAKVMIDGNFVPQTKFKNSTTLIAKKGNSLKAMLPKGKQVSVTVVNSSDQTTSPPFYFTR